MIQIVPGLDLYAWAQARQALGPTVSEWCQNLCSLIKSTRKMGSKTRFIWPMPIMVYFSQALVTCQGSCYNHFRPTFHLVKQSSVVSSSDLSMNYCHHWNLQIFFCCVWFDCSWAVWAIIMAWLLLAWTEPVMPTLSNSQPQCGAWALEMSPTRSALVVLYFHQLKKKHGQPESKSSQSAPLAAPNLTASRCNLVTI